MLKYIKTNNILRIMIHNANFKIINIWRKITRLGISFMNQPFFKVFDPSNDKRHQRSCQGARVTGASSGIQFN